MIRIAVLAFIVSMLISSWLYGRHKKWQHHFFWRRIMVFWLILLSCALVAVAPLRVSSQNNDVTNRDIIFLVDMTMSVNATDGRGGSETTRIENMRQDMQSIIEANLGATMGIVTFSDKVDIYMPLTSSSNDVSKAAQQLYTPTYLYGLSKVAPYQTVFEETAKYLQEQYKTDPTRERVVVMMSDFEIFNQQEPEQQAAAGSQALSNTGAGFVPLIYGQDQPARMLNLYFNFDEYRHEYQRNAPDFEKYWHSDYKIVFSTANFKLAEDIARVNGSNSVRANETQDFTEAITRAIRKSAKSARATVQSQALAQNIFYVVPAAIGVYWLVTSEILRSPRVVALTMRQRTQRKKRQTLDAKEQK